MGLCINRAKDEFIKSVMQSVILSKEQQETLQKFPIYKTYSKGTLLFNKGDCTTLYYFVIKGGIRTYKLVDGKDVSLNFILDNEALSPTSTILQQPSDVYAVCFEDTILVALTGEMQESIESQIPEFQSICRKFSEKLLAQKQETLDRYKALSLEQAYRYLIKERPQLIQRVPQYHIATYLGIRPESLSRIRRRISKSKTP